ncbi:hypothetical protein B0A55_00165 [Friedmanniomyces simplex]|uniref:Heterokaryon incompatibility domain-containing protein n=1 Tax=Friedmanniomyces simplex TaxID=329884 RepID=A0A4U0Y137_9PEZI|nr:hypothetical protein B0A55_00165 [Friedmanniomyces simplex]
MASLLGEADFVYQPLRNDRPEFRLLELQPAVNRVDPLRCTIRHAVVDASAYCALSYVWGDQEANKSEMEITYKRPKRRLFESKKHYREGSVVCRKEIGSNLAMALRHVRQRHACVVIWVDALCINQADNDERSWQVTLMTKIYSNATVVHAWLGPQHNERTAVITTNSAAFEYIDLIWALAEQIKGSQKLANENDWLQACFTIAQTPAEDLQQRSNRVHQVWATFSAQLLAAVTSHAEARQIYIALDTLSQADYFSRMWILQETGRARGVTFHYGEHQASHRRLLLSLGLTRAFWGSLTKPQLRALSSDFDSRFLSCVMARMTCSKALRLHEVLKFAYLERSTHSATNPRDLVYALLGLASNQRDIKVNYNLTVDEVYISAARFLLEGGFTELLITFRPYKRSKGLLSEDFPSWAYDWSTRGLPSFAKFNAAKDTKPQLSFISYPGSVYNIAMNLKGTRIGRVAAVGDSFSALASSAGLSQEATRSGRLQQGGNTRALSANEKRTLSTRLARAHPSLRAQRAEIETLLLSQSALPLGNFWCWWVEWTSSLWRLAGAHTKSNNNLSRHIAELLSRETPPRISSNKAVKTLTSATDLASLINLQSWSHFLFPRPVQEHDQPTPSAARPLTAPGIDLLESLFRSAWGTRPCTLDTDFLASAPERVQEGDEIVLLHGVNAPLVLRKADEEAYRIVGPAHVCGAMQGQLMSVTASVETYTLV